MQGRAELKALKTGPIKLILDFWVQSHGLRNYPGLRAKTGRGRKSLF